MSLIVTYKCDHPGCTHQTTDPLTPVVIEQLYHMCPPDVFSNEMRDALPLSYCHEHQPGEETISDDDGVYQRSKTND